MGVPGLLGGRRAGSGAVGVVLRPPKRWLIPGRGEEIQGGRAALPQLSWFPRTATLPVPAHPRRDGRLWQTLCPKTERKVGVKPSEASATGAGGAPGATHSPWSSGAAFPDQSVPFHPVGSRSSAPCSVESGSRSVASRRAESRELGIWLLTGSTRALLKGRINIS